MTSEQDLVLPHLSTLANIDPVSQKVGFIVNAADPYRGTSQLLPWMEKEFQQWCNLGYNTDILELLQIEDGDLNKYSILHFAGGNPLYLCLLLKKNGLINIIQHLVYDKNTIFSGSSAGSMIAGTDVRAELFADLEAYPENKDLITKFDNNFEALKLVPFNFIPHYNNPEYTKQYSLAISDKDRTTDPLIVLNDGQAIWVDGDIFKIISE